MYCVKSKVFSMLRLLVFSACFLAVIKNQGAPVALNPNLQIRLVLNTPTSSQNVRIAKDPRNNQLYYLKINGDIYRVNLQPGNASTSVKVYSTADYGASG